jgi:predicted transcriptional regulator
VRRGGKDGMQKIFFPFVVYISTFVNVNSDRPSSLISNIPLLTIVNAPTVYKPFAFCSAKEQSSNNFYVLQSLKKIKTLNISINEQLYPLMKRVPCEYMIWNGLPLIRKEIAESLMTNFGLSQKAAAEKLGITPAAVCQYVSHKRGNQTIKDEELTKEITLSAQRILNDPNNTLMQETCRICKIFMAKGIFPPGCESCQPK